MAASLWLPLLAALVAWAIVGWVARRALRLRLIAQPNGRSSHAAPTPSGGGIGIVMAGFGAGVVLALRGGAGYWPILLFSALIAGMGLRDDIRPLPQSPRLAIQGVACAALLVLLDPMGDQAPWLLLGFLWLASVWWINLFNFMDGIDGIAGSQAVFMLGTAAALGWATQEDIVASPTWIWMLAIGAAALGFLTHNWAPARIFMGDVGSTYLAFMILALALLSIHEGWLNLAFWTILAAAFAADATVTLLRRLLTGQRWREAHRSHAYQRLARRWGSHARASGLYLAIDLLWLAPLAGLSLWRPDWSPWLCILAYAPLVIGAWMLDAGKADQ